jgi:hypothetical protein
MLLEFSPIIRSKGSAFNHAHLVVSLLCTNLSLFHSTPLFILGDDEVPGETVRKLGRGNLNQRNLSGFGTVA